MERYLDPAILAGATAAALLDPLRLALVGLAGAVMPTWWAAIFAGVVVSHLVWIAIVLRAPVEFGLSISAGFPVSVTSGAIISLLAWSAARGLLRLVRRP
ncbi:hypothetical protein [Roseococcus thiosulfatophilus]|uniref:hypothetical protein n=1 Tax=Roseococcus thiosulfatophilus TaxID=35813 RepID=UPI001A8D3DBC|nr:hypothetical protein [Roseococcus thiosulfatophilus]